jgi:hypothetical protein
MIYQLIGRLVVRLGLRFARKKIRANPAKMGAIAVVALVVVAGLAAARSSEA